MATIRNAKTPAKTLHMSLRQARTSVGMAVNDLAKLLGVAPRTVSRWELGQALPRARPRAEIVARLGPMLDEKNRGDLMMALGLQPPAPAVVPLPVEQQRAALTAVIREAAEALDVPAGRLRIALDAVLAEVARLGLDAAASRDLVRAKGDERRTTARSRP